MSTALLFSACSEDDILENGIPKGMVLHAIVEETAKTENLAQTRAEIDNSLSIWKFSFSNNDVVKVTNSTLYDSFYSFTNNGTEFSSVDAKSTNTDATWYAYYPSESVPLIGQSGKWENIAKIYALVGATETPTNGREGLTIKMYPKVAILKIENYKGSIDINVKNGKATWVSSLSASGTGFNVETETSQQNLLSTTFTGTYYVVVPAGVQLSIKDGDATVKSTGVNGLTAGSYYELTIGDPYNGHEYVDLGLSVKWATCNIGATTPEGYGDYFAWGETESKSLYNWSSYRLCSGSAYAFTKYCTSLDYGTVDNKTTLEPVDDAAHVNWGGIWRMPTITELEELLNNCTWTWTIRNEVNGHIFTSKKNGNSIFLPATGSRNGEDFYNVGSYGGYWSSSLSLSVFDKCNASYYLDLASGGVTWESSARSNGLPVRAVCQ